MPRNNEAQLGSILSFSEENISELPVEPDSFCAFKLHVKIAESQTEIQGCKLLVRKIYQSRYGIKFSNFPDPKRKIETFPDRFLMAEVDGVIYGCLGLYLSNTYCEQFGQISDMNIETILKSIPHSIPRPYDLRELSRLAVKPGLRSLQAVVVKCLSLASHMRDFIHFDSDQSMILCCGKSAIFRWIHHRSGIRTRFVKFFPKYKSHEDYVSKNVPMEIRLVVPKVDVPELLYTIKCPFEKFVLIQKSLICGEREN